MRRVAVLVLALVVLAPSVSRASAWYRCADDGVLRAACCCPPQANHHGAEDTDDTELRAACCCAVTPVAARVSSVRAAPPIAIELAPALTAPTLIAIAAPRLEPVLAPATELGGGPRGPPAPLFVRHCALLL